MAMQKYKPIAIAYFLTKKNMFSPMHYYILTTLKNVSFSYQSSVMLELLKRDVENSEDKYHNLVKLVKTEKILRHIHSRKRSDIG